MVASVQLKLVYQNTKCEDLVGFPKSSHIRILMYNNHSIKISVSPIPMVVQ